MGWDAAITLLSQLSDTVVGRWSLQAKAWAWDPDPLCEQPRPQVFVRGLELKLEIRFGVDHWIDVWEAKKASLCETGVMICHMSSCEALRQKIVGGWEIREQTHRWTNLLVKKHTIDLSLVNKNFNAVSTGRRRFRMIGAMFSSAVPWSLCCWRSTCGP